MWNANRITQVGNLLAAMQVEFSLDNDLPVQPALERSERRAGRAGKANVGGLRIRSVHSY